MKVTFPHMGNMYVCVKALLEEMGVEVVVPPQTSKRTISLGTRNSPEFACLPMKVNIGNFIEAHELGADTIVMAGGVGPCRFGYYAQVQREILKDLGYDYKMVVLEPPEKHISELLGNIRYVTGNKSWFQVIMALRLAWYKARALDELELWVHRLRPREYKKGEAERVYRQAIRDIDQAKTCREVLGAATKAGREFGEIQADWTKKCLKIGLVGEIFVVLEPFANLNVEKHLGELGIEVERSIYLSEWINEHLFMGLLRKVKNSKEAKKSARPYINHTVGGHGQDTIGHTVLYKQEGYDGVVQLAPFTCMPEIVAQSVLPKVSRDYDIPTLSLVVDEHAGEAGVMTRLEAFVDLLSRKSEGKERVNL
ncbi:MAG: CoA protein activase [Thermincolia bacterium]